jgi:hypothetical protein
MSTPSTASPLATTLAPAVAPPAPPASNVIDFFTAPVTTGDEYDVKLALAAGATREQLGLEPSPTKESATPTQLGGEAGAGDASGAGQATESTAGTGGGEGAETPVQRLVKKQIAKLEGELAALAPQGGHVSPTRQ